ncbi:MAG: XRE family transcriptional regulator [Phycisphaerae bacterium]|nr:XRE family transcriptional regulator [Phycisphaerae bacterium]
MTKRMEKLGQKLRSHRKTTGLTLEQLSNLAGVSKAMLSQIEQNKINPTVAIILKISDALNISITELIEDTVQKNILRVIHDSDDHYTFHKSPLCEIRTLSPLSLEKSIEFYRIKLEATGELRSESHFSGTQEIIHVSKGKIKVTSGIETITLSKGDSAHYNAGVPHCLQNQGKTSAEAFLIVRYQERSA